jgi:regulatory protein YycI of two-component signal transduction system YycFG
VDWNKTKTIFIITFLILDLFLAYQLIQKRNSSQLDVMTEISIDEKLEAEQITYVELPKEPTKASYISAESKKFSEEELAKLNHQQITLIGDSIIHGVFKKPIPLPDTDGTSLLQQLLQDHIIKSDQYVFWKKDEKTNTLIFFQQFKGRTIFQNEKAKLIIYLNDKNEMVSYEQTLLENIEHVDEEQEILPAIKALEILYRNSVLTSGSHVSKVELGYYTLAPGTASQVLAPTWHIVVDEKNDFYVNAFEGQIIKQE